MDTRKRILLVEDDDNLRTSLRDKLAIRYDVDEAADGETAITQVIDHRPGLIILDLLIPKVDGFSVLARIRQYPDEAISQTPIIIFSNFSSTSDIMKAQNLRVDEYLVKAHTTIDYVIERVNEVMGQTL